MNMPAFALRQGPDAAQTRVLKRVRLPCLVGEMEGRCVCCGMWANEGLEGTGYGTSWVGAAEGIRIGKEEARARQMQTR
jgi:hypothetical protein